jgi:hypothetical protein
MGRPRSDKYIGHTEKQRAFERKRFSRAKKRQEAGLAPVLTATEQRAEDRVQDNALVSSLRAMLIAKGRTDLADKLYPNGHRAACQ